ncbi:hypothetical protein OEA41_003655 [Lepraria neglecta]|uniref:Xylanolytic transcriptional activator regulatory domain-containing protein n=1 Tax=Lepraria neglecta TaxID=209136 RepID=A0AAD9Z527_9LECA|nr:hypothetical protein OEA41_003655 [Lepraria neglecta]
MPTLTLSKDQEVQLGEMKGGQQDQGLDRMDLQDNTMHTQDGFAESLGLHSPQCLLPPQAFMDAPAGNPSNQILSSNRNAVQRPSARRNQYRNSDEHWMTPRRMNSTPTVGVREGSSQAVVSDSHDRSKGSSKGATGYRSHNPGLGLDRYLGTSFWVTLSEEINGLKDVLNSSSDEEDEAEDGQTPASSLSSSGRQQLQQVNDSWFVISPTTPVESPGNPTPHQLYTFCEIYLANVDPVFKILHAPSLRRYLQEGAAELDCSPGSRGLEALKFAICYAATASVRVNDTRRLMWTLTSLAVRIAQAIGLHHENSSSSLRPFGKEMRRRLWWQICLLDSHAAEDRATNPVVYADSFSTKLPLQINDEDLHVDSCEEVEERQGFTDMTFCLICHEIMDTVRQLNYVPVKELGQPQSDSQEKWTQRIDAVINLQRRIEERYLRHLNLARPLHWATRIVADIITAIMWLIVYRPLQQRPDSSFSSQFADPGILGLSVEVLERAHQLNTDPAASPYRWLSQTYVQWHALAVTIAELCVKIEGPMVERAWAVLMPVFREASQHVADSNEGMLWRPIKKLMNRAQGLRQEYLDSRSVRADLSARMADWNVSDHGSHRADTGDPMFGMIENVQEAVEGVAPPMEGLQLAPSISGSAPFDWDPWLAAASTSMESSMRSQDNDDMNQMAWTNWENFVNGFQGQDEVVMSEPNGEAPGYSSIWL